MSEKSWKNRKMSRNLQPWLLIRIWTRLYSQTDPLVCSKPLKCSCENVNFGETPNVNFEAPSRPHPTSDFAEIFRIAFPILLAMLDYNLDLTEKSVRKMAHDFPRESYKSSVSRWRYFKSWWKRQEWLDHKSSFTLFSLAIHELKTMCWYFNFYKS